MKQNKYNEEKLGMSGCYAFSNSDSIIELPLQSFTYDIEIVDCFAQVQMTQTYINSQNNSLDVQYIFPIHPTSTITKLQIEFGGKKSEGVVMEKQQAKDEFDKKLKEGAGVAYYEYNPLSRDIMKMNVGNIRPQQTVKVMVTYAHMNSLVCNTFYQFKLTSTMTPRYARGQHFPQISFNSFENSKIMEGKCFWRVSVNIRSSRKILKVESITHKLKVMQKQNTINLTFASQQELPNKDFVLYYTIEDYSKPLYSLSHSDNNTTAAISFIPKYCNLSIDDAYDQLKKGISFQVDLDANKGQYIFLLDRSGSMEGIRIDNAKRALELFLRSLPEDSYFNVLSFGSNYNQLFPQSVKNTKKDIDIAVAQISKMNADMGGTEILQAIRSVVLKQIIPGYPRQLFFLTDGGVNNVNQVLKFISKHTQHTRVNSIGIGYGCSEELIRGCAEKGKGYSIFITDEEKPEQKIITLLQNTLSPLITDFNLQFQNSEKVEAIAPSPKKMPFILKNDIVHFFISFNGKLHEPFEIILKYHDTLGTSYRQKLVIDPTSRLAICPWVHKLVEFHQIQALIDSYHYDEQHEDRIFFVKNIDKKQLKEQIIKLSIKHQILTQFTAFLCVDAYSLDQINKASINNPKERISIKGMNPYDHVVDFYNQGEQQQDSCDYIDECGMMDYQIPSLDLQKIPKFKEHLRIKKPLLLKGCDASQPNNNPNISGRFYFPNPQKQLVYSFVTKQQEANGSWTEDFLNSLFCNANEMRQAFKNETDQISYLTFLVCQYILRFCSKQSQFTMIIKKGKNYVQKKSKKKWAQLENVYHRFWTPLAS